MADRYYGADQYWSRRSITVSRKRVKRRSKNGSHDRALSDAVAVVRMDASVRGDAVFIGGPTDGTRPPSSVR